MKYFLICIASFSLLFSCANSKELNESASQPLTEDQSEIIPHNNPQVIFEDIAEGDSLFASIKRSVCFGRCPAYEMKIYNSGFVEYRGNSSVTMLGLHTTTITQEQMMAFVNKAKAIKYMSMEDVYDNQYITDLPSTITSIVIDGVRKQVKKRYEFPVELHAFERLFDELMKSEEWVQQGEAPNDR
jgi:Domain of unknown function (DUF6438)